jgi:hypothetical protein
MGPGLSGLPGSRWGTLQTGERRQAPWIRIRPRAGDSSAGPSKPGPVFEERHKRTVGHFFRERGALDLPCPAGAHEGELVTDFSLAGGKKPLVKFVERHSGADWCGAGVSFSVRGSRASFHQLRPGDTTRAGGARGIAGLRGNRGGTRTCRFLDAVSFGAGDFRPGGAAPSAQFSDELARGARPRPVGVQTRPGNHFFCFPLDPGSLGVSPPLHKG